MQTFGAVPNAFFMCDLQQPNTAQLRIYGVLNSLFGKKCKLT